jgi:hypothetical protein
MDVQPCLVTLNLIGSLVFLVMHFPYRWEYIHVWRDFFSLNKYPMIILDVRYNFVHDGLDEPSRIWLPDGLMEIHDVTHHFCMKRNGIPHAFLKFHVIIMKEVSFGLSVKNTLGGHVMHVCIVVEVPL